MPIDVNSLSGKELNALISAAKKRQTTLKKRKSVTQVRKKLVTQAKAEGYTIEELFATGSAAVRAPRKSSGKIVRGSTGKVPPKYRNPANKEETWTGRGKQPRWLAALVAKGKKVEDFLIK